MRNVAFNYFMQLKSKNTKLDNVNYTELSIQPYLTSNLFNNKEAKLLYALRSRCHAAKVNFKKMHNNEVSCTFGCLKDEDQQHVFTECSPLMLSNNMNETLKYDNIFGDTSQQKEAITKFLRIEVNRKELKNNLSPRGGSAAGTLAHPM